MEVRPGPSTLRAVAQLLWTQNPFYVISAALLLYAVRRSFPAEVSLAAATTLFGVLAVYTLVLAATTIVIVRWGRVWDDARSLLISLLVVLLALSCMFDEAIVAKPQLGRGLMLAGFILAAGAIECVLVLTPIRLSLSFRIPLHLILALFFGFPAWLSTRYGAMSESVLPLSIMSFATVGAFVFLTLLPAASLGASAAAKSDTPWPWPAFPWIAFALAAVAICVRAYLISVAFDPARDDLVGFGVYYLVPFLIAISTIVLELGKSARRRAIERLALLAPVLAMCFAFPEQVAHARYLSDVQLITKTLGSPPALGIVCAVAFYAYGVCRRVAGADVGLAISICIASCIERATLDISGIVGPKPGVLLGASAVLLLLGWMLRSRGRLATGMLLACISTYRIFEDSWFLHDRGFALLNGVLVLTVAGSLLAREFVARPCRIVTMLLIVTLGVGEPLGFFGATLFQRFIAAPTYPFLLTGLALLLGERRRESELALAGLPAFLSGTIRTAASIYGSMGGSVLAAGRAFLIGSVICFVLGLAISLGKSRAPRSNE